MAAVPAAIACVVTAVAGWSYGAPVFVLALAVLLFFRDPERTSSAGSTAVLAPADGRVIIVEKISGGHRLRPEPSLKISIFMSPLSVHVNRMPVAGTVERIEHRVIRVLTGH